MNHHLSSRRTSLPFWIVLGVIASGAIANAAEIVMPSDDRPWVTADKSSQPRLRLVSTSAGPGPQTLFQWSYGGSSPQGSKLDEPLVTDRPDFTEASTTVGKDVLQIEVGYTYTHDSGNGSTSLEHSFGEPLFRYGMFADWFEWRLGLRPVQVHESSNGLGDRTTGLNDIYFGAKLALTSQQGVLPEIALAPQMTLPTGSNAFTTGEIMPGINLLYSWEITDDISFGGSTQANHAQSDAGEFHVQYAQSLTVGYGFNDKWSSYLEWFALLPAYAETAHSEHYLDGGVTYLLSDDIQFDVRAGVGLNDEAADYFIGTGVSFRLH